MPPLLPIRFGSDLYYSTLWLADDLRAPLQTLLALHKGLDDIWQRITDPNVATAKLAWWHAEVQRIFSPETPQHPLCQALQPLVTQHQLPKVWFEERLQACAMALQYQGYQSFADLNTYLHCHGSTISMMLTQVLCPKDPPLSAARQLGTSLSLLHHISELGKPLRQGRLFIAEDDLSRHQTTAAEVLNLPQAPPAGLVAVLTDYTEHAAKLYQTARKALSATATEQLQPLLIYAALQWAKHRLIQREKFAVLHQRYQLPPWRKLLQAYRLRWQKRTP